MPPASAQDVESALLSVVVVPYAGVASMRHCLDALRTQADAGAIEVIIPVDARTASWQSLGTHPLGPRIVKVARGSGASARRAQGVHDARGALIAITEDHCVPDATWCAAIRTAHAATHAAIGGAVDKQEPDGVLAWALYLSDYGRYMSPVAEGPAAYLTDCNVSYKREALQSIASVWRDAFHETAVNWALSDRGETLWLTPTMRVSHRRSRRLGAALRERYEHGRIFAGTRVAGMSLARRARLAAMTPALPAVICQRALRHGTRGGKALAAATALPAILATGVAWSLGELVGYVTGRGPGAEA
ncbi:MAG TPA: glycosyltransferase [Gemmatimonadaceae bacterium]|nr:glycosyltransferase [Gemmatimonadaceae bacterium]